MIRSLIISLCIASTLFAQDVGDQRVSNITQRPEVFDGVRWNTDWSRLEGVQCFATVADMKAASTRLKTGDIVCTSGYDEPNDGGGNEYRWDETVVPSPIDEGFVIEGTGGFFIATDQTQINVLQWDVQRDTVADQSIRAQAAVQAARDNNISTVYFPAGTYKLNLDVDHSDIRAVSIEGDGSETVLESFDANDFVIKFGTTTYGAYTSGVRNLRIEGASRTKHGVYVNAAGNIQFQDVIVRSCGLGILSNSTYAVNCDDCHFETNYVAYAHVLRTTGNLDITDVEGQTVTIDAAFGVPSGSHDSIIDGCRFDNNRIGIFSERGDSSDVGLGALTVIGSVIQGAYIGVWGEYGIGNSPFTGDQIHLIGCHFENRPPTPNLVTFDGSTEESRDLVMNAAAFVSQNTRIPHVKLRNYSQLKVDSGFPTEIDSDDTSAVHADVVHAQNNIAETNVLANVVLPSRKADAFSAAAQTPNRVVVHAESGARGILMESILNFGDSLIPNLGTATSTIVQDGALGVPLCQEISNGNGVLLTTNAYTPNVPAGLVVSTITMRSAPGAGAMKMRTLPFSSSGLNYSGGHEFWIDETWRTFTTCGWSPGGVTNQQMRLRAEQAGNYRVSGMQTVLFEDVKDAIAFQRSRALLTNRRFPLNRLDSPPTIGTWEIGDQFFSSSQAAEGWYWNGNDWAQMGGDTFTNLGNDNRLTAHWPGDANYNLTGDANDTTGRYNGTWTGVETYLQGGPHSATDVVWDFDAASYVEAPSEAGDYVDNFTICGWINPQVLAGRIVGKRATPLAWELFVNASGSVTWFDGASRTSTNVITANNWHHIAIVVEGGTGTLYIDGVPNIAPWTSTLTSNAQNVVFGRFASVNNNFYQGRMADWRIYSRPLSAIEISSLFGGP